MTSEYPISEADETLALQVVGWIVADQHRADRMLALTGLDAPALRAGLSDRGTLTALMDFVINHEADLVACAEAIGVSPTRIVAARDRIAP
ncbi:MAG TPA: DUF3572 domain-containing protein [Sphingobium sp.]|nr:DUF3572 domain-containing protein [Sphingobium sp.]